MEGAPVGRSRILPRIFLAAMCLVYVTPFFQMIMTALKGSEELMLIPPTVFARDPKWKNFVDAVKYIPFFRFMANSLILTAAVTAGSVLSNSVIAYGFSKIPWKGRESLFYLALSTMFIPFPVTIVALFDIFAKLHWVNTFLPIIVPAFFGQAFYIFLMRQFLLALPQELSDASYIDGANEFQIFARIILPLMKPSIAVVAIFAGVAAWNEFLTPLLYLQSEQLYPLSIGLQFYRSQHNVAYSLLMAASTLVVIPVIVIFLCFQRFFVEGATVGSLKG